MVEKLSLVPKSLMVLSFLMPYGYFGFPTWIFSVVHVWLFPFWYYSYDQDWGGMWEGRLSNVFTESLYDLPLVQMGFLWLVLGLALSYLLQEFRIGNFQRPFVVLLIVISLASQIMATSLILISVNTSIPLRYMIPLPIHTILVLFISIIIPKRKTHTL